MAGTSGIVATGHEQTSAAAVEVLAAGGNAFDAAIGALCAACVCEPLLTSLGGGGFLLAQPAGEPPVVFDFFVHTPGTRKHESELDFYPILADFGAATQEFHIGLGSMAVPGVAAGVFTVHRAFGSLPMAEIMAPAIRLAREGVVISDFQNYVSNILLAILNVTPQAMRLVATDEAPDRVAEAGERVFAPDLADTFEALVREGPDWFYRGEPAQQLARDCAERGGMLSLDDLAAYRVITRQAVRANSHGASFAFNAPPSQGGTLVAHALAMLDPVDLEHDDWGSPRHVLAMVSAIRAANLKRRELDQFSRGTTHQSVADEHGNLVSLTTSNGEGCAHVMPGTGVMMNNMLGEEDLSPGGFHRWTPDRRLASMMCPTVATLADGSSVALGTGGSNRIRSAVLQVLVNMFGLGMPLQHAVASPRLHLEGGHLSLEAGYPQAAVDALQQEYPDHRIWPEPNMFFGGVHAVERLENGEFRGMGDPRRGGAVAENKA
jgi:gamma-glutamyltranspeptidase/glutathione hydrolase